MRYDTCPTCGGKKCKVAKQCNSCANQGDRGVFNNDYKHKGCAATAGDRFFDEELPHAKNFTDTRVSPAWLGDTLE